MSSIDRRQLLVGAGAVAVLPAMPAIALTPPPLPFLPAFAVGTPGWHDWRVFFAATAERARQLWYADMGEQEPDASAGGSYPIEVQAVPHLANVSTVEDIHPPSVSDCIAMGWDHNCDRCYCDVSCDGDNYREIGGECVCQECQTPQEIDEEDHDDFLHWFFNERFNITDPAVLALLRPADLIDADVLDALAEEAALHPACVHLMPFARVETNSPNQATSQERSDG